MAHHARSRIALALAFAVLGGLVTACGGDPTPVAPQTTVAPAPPTSPSSTPTTATPTPTPPSPGSSDGDESLGSLVEEFDLADGARVEQLIGPTGQLTLTRRGDRLEASASVAPPGTATVAVDVGPQVQARFDEPDAPSVRVTAAVTPEGRVSVYIVSL